MRVTKKGQVTIPLEIRRRAGFAPGVEVTFLMDGDEVKLVRADRNDSDIDRAEEFEAWLKRVRGTATAGLTTDEIMEMTRGLFDDVDPGRH